MEGYERIEIPSGKVHRLRTCVLYGGDVAFVPTPDNPDPDAKILLARECDDECAAELMPVLTRYLRPAARRAVGDDAQPRRRAPGRPAYLRRLK